MAIVTDLMLAGLVVGVMLAVLCGLIVWRSRMPIFAWAATNGYRVISCRYILRRPPDSGMAAFGLFYDALMEAPGGLRRRCTVRLGPITGVLLDRLELEWLAPN